MIELADGLHSISREEYDQVDRVNFSRLRWMAKSPAHFRYHWDHGEDLRKLSKLGTLDDDDTDARQRGRIVSMAVFEPLEFRKRVVVWPGGKRSGRSWERFVANNPDCEHVTAKLHRLALKVAGAVRASEQAQPILALPGGLSEVTVAWTHETPTVAGVPGYAIKCKARLDHVVPELLIADLKNSLDAGPEGFPREVARYHAHVQAAMYTDGVRCVTGIELPYRLIAIEPTEPFACQVWDLPSAAINLGRRTYREWLDRLAFCRAENSYPAYAQGPMTLELPRWILPPDEDGD